MERDFYLSELLRWKDLPFIKIVSGVRWSGKSVLLRHFGQRLVKSGLHPNQIIEINLEDPDNLNLSDCGELYRYILARAVTHCKYYLFLDEIYHVRSFEKAIATLFLHENFDIYLTCSNNQIISSELATLVSGRNVQIEVLPLSLKEFREAFPEKSPEELFALYLSTTSFPFIFELFDKAEFVDKVLEGIFNSVVIKDILAKGKIREPSTLVKAAEVCCEFIGERISVAKLSKLMRSAGYQTDNKTTEKYLRSLLDSFFLYEVRRWDIKEKRLLQNSVKYYFVDLGLIRTLLGSGSLADGGHLLENVVFLELKRRGYKVFTGKLEEFDVDFVCTNGQEKIYIQVAASVRDEGVLHREVRSLLRIQDNFPKYLLTLDNDPSVSIEGIHKVNALNWLLDE